MCELLPSYTQESWANLPAERYDQAPTIQISKAHDKRERTLIVFCIALKFGRFFSKRTIAYAKYVKQK